MPERKEIGPNDRINDGKTVASLRNGDQVVFLPSVQSDAVPLVDEFPIQKPIIDAAPRPRLIRQQMDSTVIGRAKK